MENRIKKNVCRWIIEALSLGALVWALWPLLFYHTLDETMPVPLHYDITGEVTRWGEPSSLWTSSVLALLVYLLLSALQKYPGVLNYPVKVTPDNAKGLYALGMDLVRGLKLLLTLLFAYTGHVTFAVAVGKGMRMSAFVIAAWLCLLVILLVTYWIKMQKLKLRP